MKNLEEENHGILGEVFQMIIKTKSGNQTKEEYLGIKGKERKKMKIEDSVPSVITEAMIGGKILYRFPNNKIAKEGIISEFSPCGFYIHVGQAWVANDGTGVLAVLSAPQKRRDALK